MDSDAEIMRHSNRINLSKVQTYPRLRKYALTKTFNSKKVFSLNQNIS